MQNPRLQMMLAAAAAMIESGEATGLSAALRAGRNKRRRERARRQIKNRAHDFGRKRLTMARGAGSINAKADILQLCDANRYSDAIAMSKDHTRQCGETLFPQYVLDAWAEYAR